MKLKPGEVLRIALVVAGAAAFAGWFAFFRPPPLGPDDKVWANAERSGAPVYYEVLIELYPDSPHVPAARARLAGFDFAAAEQAGTVRALQGFLAEHPDAPQAADALDRMEALRSDPAPWERVRASGDYAALAAFLEDFPGHVAEPEVREALRPYDGIDLFELVAAGWIAVEAYGGGVAAVNLTLRNLTGKPVNVRVPPGAYFQSGDLSVQSMVTTAPAEIFLPTADPASLRVAAACANLHLREPSGSDGLTLHPEPIEGPLAQVLAGAPALDPTARQAAVWIMTDDATLSELGVLNTMNGAAAARGARLVEEAGVDLRALRIWNDMPSLLHQSLSVADDATSLWVWSALGSPLVHVYSPGYEIPYLALAVRYGGMQMVEALLAAGADVNAPIPQANGTATVIAEAGGSSAMVERLLAAGAELDARGLWTTAVERRAYDVIDLLLERGAPPPRDVPLLVYAGHRVGADDADGDAALVRRLLELGQPVDQMDDYGRTPLHVSLRSAEAVRLLLAAGADPNTRNGDGRSVLQELAWEGFANPDAAANLRQLLDAGADPAVRDEDGDTLLHDVAASGWSKEGVPLLLEAGLDPNAVNERGETPLHAVAASSYDSAPDKAAILINAGARRARDARGRTPEELVRPDSWTAEKLRQTLALAPD